VCSSPERALQLAAAAEALRPASLVVHTATDGDLALVRATGDPDRLADVMAPFSDVGLYRTAARSLLRHRRRWPLGESTPGVSRIYFTRARPGLSADDYHRYWEPEHGPRALRHHMGMWDYTQISVTETLAGEHFDGIAATVWPRVEELDGRFTDGPLGDAIIAHDAAQFTDVENLARYSMDERVVVEAPVTAAGRIEVTDARHLEFGCPAESLWGLIGDFAAIGKWWPSPLTCSISSESGVGATRTLHEPGGPEVVERLTQYRPEERMLQLAIDHGLPLELEAYTSRYEVRPVGPNACRLDWYPRGILRGESVEDFGAFVDAQWEALSAGLIAVTGG
jgi:hypothetical protein